MNLTDDQLEVLLADYFRYWQQAKQVMQDATDEMQPRIAKVIEEVGPFLDEYKARTGQAYRYNDLIGYVIEASSTTKSVVEYNDALLNDVTHNLQDLVARVAEAFDRANSLPELAERCEVLHGLGQMLYVELDAVLADLIASRSVTEKVSTRKGYTTIKKA